MRALLPLVLLLLTSLAPSAAALSSPLKPATGIGDPSPYAANAVETQYELRLLPSLEAFAVEIRLRVFEIQLAGPEGVPAQTIRDGGATRSLFEEAVRAEIEDGLRRAFPQSGVRLNDLSVDYGASNGDADLYRPGIDVLAHADLPLTASLLGASGGRGSASDWAKAFFYSGGAARVERTLPVSAGFTTVLRLLVPPTMSLDAPGIRDASIIEFRKDNLRGQMTGPLYARFDVALRPEHVPDNVRAGPLVRATFVAHDETPLWRQAIPFAGGEYSADLTLEIELPSLSTSLFEESLLPSHLRLDNVSADLLRVAIRDGLVLREDLQSYFEASIRDGLRKDFGEKLQVDIDAAAFDESLAQPVSGANVEPILVRAKTRLPLQADRMLASSSIAQSLGMLTGVNGRFDLANNGDWRLELILLYPEGVDVSARDTLGRSRALSVGEREGFALALGPGEATTMKVWGRPGFDATVFLIGILEIILLAAIAVYVTRQARARLKARRFPWQSV